MKDDNRLELLLFHLGSEQQFGINVLKVKEIIDCPALTQLPDSHPSVCGVARLRGEALSVIDISRALGKKAIYNAENESDSTVIIAEFSRVSQGFLVERVDRIALCDWKNILPPPKGLGSSACITGVTEIDGKLVQILDVESILGTVVPVDTSHLVTDLDVSDIVQGQILIVDDSALARKQIAETIEAINLSYIAVRDGKEALEVLRNNKNDSSNGNTIAMVVSDIEMPEMDGYTLTETIRQEAGIENMYILLHTSLNGDINVEKAKQAGANDMLTKFIPEELMQKIVIGLQQQS